MEAMLLKVPEVAKILRMSSETNGLMASGTPFCFVDAYAGLEERIWQDH